MDRRRRNGCECVRCLPPGVCNIAPCDHVRFGTGIIRHINGPYHWTNGSNSLEPEVPVVEVRESPQPVTAASASGGVSLKRPRTHELVESLGCALKASASCGDLPRPISVDLKVLECKLLRPPALAATAAKLFSGPSSSSASSSSSSSSSSSVTVSTVEYEVGGGDKTNGLEGGNDDDGWGNFSDDDEPISYGSMCADVVEVAATFGGGTGEAVPGGGSNALASASASGGSGGGTVELEGDDVCLDTIGEAAIAASSFSGSSSAASIATGASAFGANFSARNTAGRGPSSASSSNAPASQPVTVNYKTLSFAEKVEKLEANQLLRRDIDSMQSVLAAPRALDLGVAVQALRHDQNRAKEDSMRSFMRQHASAAIKNGYAADADRVETMNLPTAKASRAYVLKTMSERGVTVIPITHSLSNGEAPVTSHHIPLVSSLRMVLEDARIPEGSIGRITPSIEGGPSWMPPQSTSLVDPGDVLWMGDLPLVREGFSAAISAAAASWFWEPLRHICKTRGVQLDVFAMPLLGSHDETLIGTQDTADPVLTQIIAARGGFATSTDSIFCRGFINKPPIGECPTPAARARTLEVWHRQLYLAFASELDQYFDGMPLLMSRVPGLERGSQPNTIYLALPYSVAMCLDWMALLSSAHRK